MIGYQILAGALEVEFNDVLKRWMFCSEVKERSVISPMRTKLCYMEKEPRKCRTPGRMRKLFVLDDGESYVVVARHPNWRLFKKDRPEILFCVDAESEMIRRQTVQELEANRAKLEKAKPRFLFDDEDANYMPLVRYLERM
jgi:hypothetical protein